LKIAEQHIAAALEPLGFQMQSGQNDITSVRPNATIDVLFERVEWVYAGSFRDTIVLSVALSVVQHACENHSQASRKRRRNWRQH
jgi:hypothetical protein